MVGRLFVRGRGMVPDVAIKDLERSGCRVPDVRLHRSCVDTTGAAGSGVASSD